MAEHHQLLVEREHVANGVLFQELVDIGMHPVDPSPLPTDSAFLGIGVDLLHPLPIGVQEVVVTALVS
jgi:hypothetical protein